GRKLEDRICIRTRDIEIIRTVERERKRGTARRKKMLRRDLAPRRILRDIPIAEARDVNNAIRTDCDVGRVVKTLPVDSARTALARSILHHKERHALGMTAI